MALYFATSVHSFEDWHSELPCFFTFHWLTISFSFVSWRPWLAFDFTRTCGNKHFMAWCVLSLLERVWTGDFSEQEDPATLFLINLYFRIVCSPSADSKYFYISKSLFICLSISFVSVLSLLHLIEKFIMIICHRNNTDKFVTASLDHSSFNIPLIHQVIWRINSAYVWEKEKGNMQKLLQAYKSKHNYTFCPHGIMVRHSQYVAYFFHRSKIKVLRTEKMQLILALYFLIMLAWRSWCDRYRPPFLQEPTGQWPSVGVLWSVF